MYLFTADEFGELGIDLPQQDRSAIFLYDLVDQNTVLVRASFCAPAKPKFPLTTRL